jgi:Na+/citrate or Na+/malate symporter
MTEVKQDSAGMQSAEDAVRSTFSIGVIPWPIYLILLAVLGGFTWLGKLPSDISLMIALLGVGGFTCGELGKRIPVIKTLGAAAIFATFVPSYLVYAKILPKVIVTSVTTFTKDSQFLFLYIAAIIVGSVLSMDRQVLVRGFLKVFIPMLAGTVAAGIVGISVGLLFGMSLHDIFFFVLVPALGGGVGEGALPLSIGYAAITHQDQGLLLARILPAVMFASLTAIVFSGLLNHYARTRPAITGFGTLQMGEHDDIALLNAQPDAKIGPQEVAAAGITAVALYLIGLLGQTIFKFPGPITMLILAILLNLGRTVTPSLRAGAYAYYKFFSTAVTYPLLFAIGVALTPWDKLIAAFTPAMVFTIISSVGALMATGFYVGRMLGMYPVETAIITGCRASQGGTGDVAILTACDRLQLMPFAQISTRIGGAATVTLALALMRIYG